MPSHITTCLVLSPRFLQSMCGNIIALNWHLKGPPHQSDTHPPCWFQLLLWESVNGSKNLINSRWMASFINYSWAKSNFNDTRSSTLKYAGVEKTGKSGVPEMALTSVSCNCFWQRKHLLKWRWPEMTRRMCVWNAMMNSGLTCTRAMVS